MDHAEAARMGVVERYLLDQLGEPETSQYEEHFFDCPECAQEVEVCAALLAGARPDTRASDPDITSLHRRHRIQPIEHDD